MKTIEQAAAKYADTRTDRIEFRGVARAGFIEGAAFAQRWIPVSEEVPEENTEVLVKCRNGKRIQHDVDFIMNGVFHRRKNVTHWRPIELNS